MKINGNYNTVTQSNKGGDPYLLESTFLTKIKFNYLLVDGVNGDDAKAVKNTQSAYKTITAANAAATTGDTVVVNPSTYDEAGILALDVNYFFFVGAIVTNATSDIVQAFTNSTNTISGYGSFVATGSNEAVRADGNNQHLLMEFLEVKSNTSSAIRYGSTFGRQSFRGLRVYSETSAAIHGGGGAAGSTGRAEIQIRYIENGASATVPPLNLTQMSYTFIHDSMIISRSAMESFFIGLNTPTDTTVVEVDNCTIANFGTGSAIRTGGSSDPDSRLVLGKLNVYCANLSAFLLDVRADNMNIDFMGDILSNVDIGGTNVANPQNWGGNGDLELDTSFVLEDI
ncbi:MAG: hypothetical protein S4CHLAM20_04230 [Chlamydiia bacterium]|nr:hypothetical protein [Chlamydiia bacterium]